MRIALDLTPLVGRFPTSVVRTVDPLVRALRAVDGLELVEVRPDPARDLGRFGLPLWRQHALPRRAAAAGADLLHVFSSAFPLRSRVPVVRTVHELPWRRGESSENAGVRHRAWVRLGGFARATCTPSAEVAAALPGAPFVVPWGVGAEFLAETAAPLPAELRRALPDGPFVLAPGAVRPKKRLDRVLAGARRAGLATVVTGAFAGGAEPAAEDVIALGHVDGAHLPALFGAAAAVALLADSEGFGLPVLEAFARGTAVIATRGSVQAATAGGLAYEVEADDARAVAEALVEAVEAGPRPERRAFAAQRGWDRTAARLVDVWGEVL